MSLDDERVARLRPRLGPLLLAAATRWRNRFVVVTAALAGLVVILAGHAWIGLAITGAGAASYAGLVFRDLFDPKLIREVHGLRGTWELAEDVDAGLHRPLQLGLALDAVEPAQHRELLRSIMSAHEAIRGHLLGSSAVVRHALRETYRRCTEVARAAEPLALRGQKLDQYLAAHRPDAAQGDVDALEASASQSDDGRTSLSFRAAARARQGYVETYRDMERHRERIKAQLVVINASLQLVEAQLVKLELCEAREGLDATATVEELSDLLSIEFDLPDLDALDTIRLDPEDLEFEHPGTTDDCAAPRKIPQSA